MPILMAILPSVAVCLFALMYEHSVVTEKFIRGAVFKSLATCFCILIAVAGCILSDGKTYPLLIILGMLFGLLGDAALVFRFILPQKKSKLLVYGAFFFFVGHIIYVIALCYHFPHFPYAALPLLVVAMLIQLAVARKNGTRYGAGKYFLPLLAYLASVCFMACYAIGVCIQGFSVGTLIFALGGISFAISDTVLSVQYFTKKASPAKARALHTFYWLAQALIAATTLFI